MHLHPLLVALAALAGPPRDTVPLYNDLGELASVGVIGAFSMTRRSPPAVRT